MKPKYYLLAALFLIFPSCSPQAPLAELSDPGFGVIASSIEAIDEGVDIPVLMKTADVVKGIQFTLTWDPAVGQVLKPALTATNPGFTISASEGGRGVMKVLIFSMSGEILETSNPNIMTIPIRIINPDAPLFKLEFKDAIFAGPNAMSYPIPVQHANLKINA